MANSDKNIRIQPNRNSTLFPKITFTGQSNNPITLNVLDDNSISFEGSAGQLFSINNNLSSGYIFSVNDISGLPSFRINADGTVGIAEFYGNVGIGITNPSYKFHARGDSYFSSTGNTALLLLSGTGGTIIASNSVNITLTDPARKGLVINAASLQTANIFEWYADGGVGAGYSLAGRIRPSGHVNLGNTGTITMSTGTSALLSLQGRGSTEGLAIRGFNSNLNEPLFEVQGNPGNQLFGIYGDGGVNAPRINVTNGTASTTTTNGALIVTGGVGIGGSVNIGSALNVSGTTRLNSSLFNIPRTSSIGGSSGSATFGSYWTGYQVENGYLIYGRQVVGGSILLVEPSTGTQVGGTTNIFAEALKHFKWGRDKYVVLASTGNSVLYSTSPVGAGSSWYYATLPTTASWQRLEYGNNRFVAIATGSTAAYSYDGIIWSLASLPASIAWSDIKYGNGVFVAGAASTVAYSYDGIEWAIASNNVPAQNLTYGNGFFFANGGGNTASYSSDGINWTNVTLPSDTHRGSAYGNGVFFNVGASSSNYISSDLINWTATANGVGSLSVPNSPWYVNNTFFWNNNASSFGAFVAGPSGTLDLNPRFTGDINNVEIGNVKPAAAEFTTLAASGPVRFVSGLASTNFRNGSVVITGGVGIGGTLNVNNIGIGYTGIPYNPSIAFIGTTGDPIRLNVLSNNTLSFEGRSGQLFSINNNLSSGWIFSVNDISGIPLFRANADATISMAEYAGNVGIGLSNPTFKFQVNGSASIGATLNVNRLRVTSKITFEPGTGTSAVSGWTGIGLTSISKMIYGGGRFVGIGGSYVAYSSDGVNFTYTTIPGQTSAASYGDIAYGNGVFVAVNAQNVTSTAYSYDGASWGTTSIGAGGNRTVVFGNGRFLAFSEVGNGVFSSADGRNWTNIGALGEYGREAIFANGYYLSARGAHLYSSADGINWKRANTPGSNSIYAITYGKGIYLAADYNSAQYYTSTDLVTWTRRSIDNKVWTGASYVNGVFYLIPNNNNFLHHSLDGINWSTTNFGTPIGGINKLFTANDRLYFYSSWQSTLWSTDATTGTLMAKPFYNGELENTRIGAVNPDSATFTNLTALNPVTFTSATASTGTDNGALVVTNGVGIGGTLNANTVNVVRDFNHTPNITTIGGASGWVASTASTFISPYSFKYLNNKYIGIGGTYVYYSDDMINWSSVMVPNLNPAQSIYDITYGEGKYVITQYLSSNAGYSTNLTNWTVNSALQYNSWLMLEYGNGRFVATSGGNPYAYSLDGITWANTSSTTHGYSTDIKFLNGYFYSCSSGSLERSTDGITWQTCNTPAIPYGLAYGNGLYVGGVYNSGTIVYSYDGLNFSSYTGTSYVHKKAYFYNGVYYITTQNNTVIRYSTDGFNWSNSTGFPGNVDGMVYAQGKLYAGSGNTVWVTNATPGRFEVNPLRTGTLDDVEIGRLSPNNANFIDVSVNNNLNVSSAYNSLSPLNGALTVAGGVGIGGTLNANSVVTYNRLQNQSFSGASVGASDGLMGNFSSNYQYQSYGNGIYVVSSGGANNARYSTDGVTWQNTTLPVNQAYPINFYGNGYFVLSASGSTTVLYSTNGNSWSQVSIGNTFDRTSGVYGNGKYIIVGSGSTYNYSANLTTWNSATLPYNSNWYITYGNGMFVALGNGTRNLLYSYDGLNWSLGNVNTASGPWSGIKYGNGVFVASSLANPSNNTSGTIYSYDGINWYQGSISNQDFYNVSYGNGVYFGNNINAFWTSTDGANWSSATSFSFSGQSYQSAYAYNKFNTIGRFIDGPTNTVTLDPKFTGEINNVRIGALTPASGDFTNLSSTGSANLVGTVNANNLNILSKVNQTPVLGGFAGTDGWTSANLLSTSANYALAFGNGLFVSIRRGTDSTSFSSDGKRWTASTMPFVGQWNDVAWGLDKFVAVAGVGTTGAFSGNGISWSSMNMPATAQGWYAVTYGDDKFVAVGNTSTVAYSSNGINWSGSSIANTNWTGVAYGNGTFVAVSGFGLSGAYSYDGINWNLINLPTNGGTGVKFITYGNGYFIVANYVNNDINYSRDGINWSTTVRTSTYGIKTDIAYGNGIYSIFNYQEATYSYDGVNWLLGNTIGATDWQAVAYGNNRFVATSLNTGQVGSIDGPSNTLNLHPKFTGDIDNVRIGAKQPGAAEFTNLAAQQPVRFTANTPSTDSTSGALVVLGGVGIGGTVNSTGLFNFGTLQAPAISSLSGFGTGGLSPSTTYYYKLSAIDYNNNESLPSPEYSVTTSASQYGTRFFINTSPGASGYKLYRTTTSGNYANSFVQTYRTYQQLNNYRYDVGKATSAGSPVSRATGNTVTLGSSSSVPFNVLPSLTIPSGSLQVKSPNVTSFATPGGAQAAIETGPLDYLAIRDAFGYNGLSVSTGGTLTPGQTYYYVATMVDHYGNESLPTEELGITADAGGAVIIGFNVASVQIPAIRVYRTTTPGNYTNSYLGELPGNKDIGYPTMSGSPPTTTSFAGIRLNPRADFDVMSYIPNIDLAPSHRNGFLRKLDVPYTGAIAVTTSGTAGSLLPNTTYYYKCSAFDIFGGSAYPTAEVSVSTGTSTAVTISGGGGILYAKVYRSTTKNNYSNVPTYLVNSFPFTDRGDTTFTDTPSNVSTYIQSQLFRNQNNSVPQNYLRDLSIGPILNNFPFSILAPVTGLGSVTASTGGTLVEGQVYYYVMEAVDIYNYGSSSGQPIRFVATAGGAANVTQYIVGGYGYVAWNLYRTSNLASWTNSLIAAGIKGTSFIDIGYPGRSGSPNFGYHRARNVVFDNRGVFHIPTIANQFYGQNITAPSAPYRTGGSSAGSLTTNTTYYYRVMPYGGANQSYGYASDEFQYTTGANEKSISMTIGGHKIGAMYYRVYRSTTFNNFTNAYYFETPHTSFIDYGHTALQATGDVFINNVPYANTVNLLNQASGNYLAYTTITGQTGGLKIHLKSPVISSISSGTGGTLSTNTDYWYKVDAIDAYGLRTFVSDEAYINTGANNSVTLTWDDVPGAYYYRVFRATASQTFSNKLIASYVSARTFTDLNFPATTGTPVTIFENGQNGNTAALFQMDNTKYFGIMPRTIISNIDSSQANWYTDFSLRITSPAVPSASAALLQVGAGFTNFSSAGFNGSIYGTQIAIGAAVGFTGSLLDAQTAGISRFRINFDGSATIGSTTGSGSTTSGALIVSGGVGIGGSLNIGSDVIINGGRESNSTSTGSLIVRGGVGITGGLYVKPFSLSTKGLVVQANTSQTGNLFELQNSASSTITSFNASGELNITSTTGSTSASFGSIVTAGGVGIGGSVSIGSTAGSSNTTSGALKVTGGVGIGGALNVGGSVNFSSSIFGGVSTSIVPTMTFIGQANDPITLSVLSDNSLSFDGSSGQLFSINNNLSTGWIFSISDISGLPLFRTNADGTVSMGEFGGNVGIGLTNPTYKLQVAGNAGIANTLFVSGRANIGNTSFTDIYGNSYNPIITATDTFDDDIVIQIENKSDGVNARAGLLFKNNTNSVAQLYLSGGNYGGAGLGFSEIRLYGDYPFVIDTKSTSIRASTSEVVNFDSTKMTVVANTESTSSANGSLIVSGGAGIAKSVNIGGFLSSKPAYATAGLGADQTLTSGADNLILFTDNADPNTWWTGVAGVGVSHIFKPTITGLYFVALQVHFKTGSGSGQMNIQARKNGSAFSLSQDVLNTVEGRTLNLSGLVSLNGSTDYVDFTAYTNSSGTPLLTGEGNRQYSHAVIYKIF